MLGPCGPLGWRPANRDTETRGKTLLGPSDPTESHPRLPRELSESLLAISQIGVSSAFVESALALQAPSSAPREPLGELAIQLYRGVSDSRSSRELHMAAQDFCPAPVALTGRPLRKDESSQGHRDAIETPKHFPETTPRSSWKLSWRICACELDRSYAAYVAETINLLSFAIKCVRPEPIVHPETRG